MQFNLIAGLWFAILQLSLCAALLGQTTAAHDPQSDDLAAVSEFLSGAETGTPSEARFFAFVTGKLQSNSKAGPLWQKWIEAQRPSPKQDELQKLLVTRRSAITSVEIAYHVTRKPVRADGAASSDVSTEYEAIYLLSKNQQLFRRTEIDRNLPEGLRPSVTRAYDGQVLRVFEVDPHIGSRAWIAPYRGREQFLEYENPLALSMMVDTATDLRGGWWLNDINAIITFEASILQEAEEKMDGVSCKVIAVGAPASHKVFLDPRRGFCPVSMESYSLVIDPRGQVTGRHLDYRRGFADVQEVIEGVWLPRIYSVQWLKLDEGQQPVPVYESRITVTHVRFNADLPDEAFRRIFPRRIEVRNQLTNEVVMNAEEPIDLEDLMRGGSSGGHYRIPSGCRSVGDHLPPDLPPWLLEWLSPPVPVHSSSASLSALRMAACIAAVAVAMVVRTKSLIELTVRHGNRHEDFPA